MPTRSRRSRIDDVLEQHAADLDALNERSARQVLAAYEDSRRELRDRLRDMERSGEAARTPFTAQQLRVALAQVEDGAVRLRERLTGALDAGERAAHDQALSNLLGVVKAAESKFRDAGSQIEVAALRRLADERGLALHQYSVQRYGAQVVDAIQRELVVGVTQGLTVAQLADRIAGAGGSVMAGMRGRAELIARMELSRAYNAGHQASLEELAATDPPDTPDPLLKKADEYIDARNHPLSRALHGRAVLPRQEWEVPVAAVHGSLSGIVWARTGAFVHGFNYPAHFNERGRQIPWRASWGPCILQPTSFRERHLKREDVRALRRIGAGQQLDRVSPTSRQRLELAGYVDGQGRLLPPGRRALSEQGALGRQTWPSGQPDPSAVAGGQRPKVRGDATKRRAMRRQIETADAMAQAGWKVEHRPEQVTGKNPDLLVEGRVFDVIAPSTSNPRSIATTLKDKVVGKQSNRFVVNLDDSPATIDEVREAWALDHLSFQHVDRTVEVILLKGGQFVRVVG